MKKSTFLIAGKHAVTEAFKNTNRKVLRIFLTEDSKKTLNRDNQNLNLLKNIKLFLKDSFHIATVQKPGTSTSFSSRSGASLSKFKSHSTSKSSIPMNSSSFKGALSASSTTSSQLQSKPNKKPYYRSNQSNKR